MSWEQDSYNGFRNEPFDPNKHFPLPVHQLTWYYLDKDTPNGPFEMQNMYAWLVKGYFNRDTLIRVNPNMAWMRIADVYPDEEQFPFEKPPTALLYKAGYKPPPKTKKRDDQKRDDRNVADSGAKRGDDRAGAKQDVRKEDKRAEGSSYVDPNPNMGASAQKTYGTTELRDVEDGYKPHPKLLDWDIDWDPDPSGVGQKISKKIKLLSRSCTRHPR